MPSRGEDSPINKDHLEQFLRQIPALAEVAENHSQLVAHFGYYITEALGEDDLTPKRIRACYDAASIPTPANISDAMQRSRAFVSTAAGTRLHRDTRNRIQASLTTTNPAEQRSSFARHGTESPDKARNVVVVHGRDLGLRDSMFQLLRSVGLTPIEWNEAVRRTAQGSPYTGQVVDVLFRDAQAIVVILSPDERVELREDLQVDGSVDNSGWQPRPNVFIETGMALARDEAHTILVQIGEIRQATDLVGRNSIRFDGSSAHRHGLIERLRTAGCAISTAGDDWLRVGNFDTRPTRKAAKRKTK